MLQWLKTWNDFPHPFSTRLLTRACIWGARVETQLRLPKTVPYHVWMLYVLLYISLIFFEEKCAEAHKCVEVVEKASAKGNEGCWKNINTHWQTTMCCVSIFLTTDLVFAMIGIGRQFPLCANISKRHHKNTKQTSQTSQRHRPNFLNMSETKTKFTNIPKTQNKHLEHLKLCNKGVSYVYLMIKLTFKSAVTHPKDTDLTRIVCIYNHHNQYLHVSVWNTEKRDTKQNHHIVWCCARAYETFQWKAVPILGLPERWLHPWSLRPLPVQFTRAFVILSSAPVPLQLARLIFKMLVSACAALAVQQIASRIPGLYACHPCSLPEFSPTMSWWFNMTLQVSSVILCWVVLTLACPEIVPVALPCCLSYICFGARCAWSNRLCVEFSVVSGFRLPTSFADLVFAMTGIGHESHTCVSWTQCLSKVLYRI